VTSPPSRSSRDPWAQPAHSRGGCAGAAGFLARLVLALVVPAVLASQLGQWLAPRVAPDAALGDSMLTGAVLGILVGLVLGLSLLRRAIATERPGVRAADCALILMALALLVRTALELVCRLPFEQVALAYACLLGLGALVLLLAGLGGRRA
jgi:hypothetical protein